MFAHVSLDAKYSRKGSSTRLYVHRGEKKKIYEMQNTKSFDWMARAYSIRANDRNGSRRAILFDQLVAAYYVALHSPWFVFSHGVDPATGSHSDTRKFVPGITENMGILIKLNIIVTSGDHPFDERRAPLFMSVDPHRTDGTDLT